MKIAFCTYCSDKYFYSFGADKLSASSKYFHYDIPLFVYGTKDIEGAGMPIESLHPLVMEWTMAKGDFDAVVYFDADSIIAGSLDELFKLLEIYEVVCVRNNNDYGKAGISDPITQAGKGVNTYVNAGLVATTSKAFISEWLAENRKFAGMLPFGSQSVLNTIVDNYRWGIIDRIDSDTHYGVSVLAGENSLRGVDFGEQSHWDSWKSIGVIDDELVLFGKKIKVLHHAGGFQPYKLGLHLFSDSARERLIEIIYG